MKCYQGKEYWTLAADQEEIQNILLRKDLKPKAKPIIDENAGAATYITLPCANYVVTEIESADALDKAKQDLINRMLTFDYENQL